MNNRKRDRGGADEHIVFATAIEKELKRDPTANPTEAKTNSAPLRKLFVEYLPGPSMAPALAGKAPARQGRRAGRKTRASL